MLDILETHSKLLSTDERKNLAELKVQVMSN